MEPNGLTRIKALRRQFTGVCGAVLAGFAMTVSVATGGVTVGGVMVGARDV